MSNSTKVLTGLALLILSAVPCRAQALSTQLGDSVIVLSSGSAVPAATGIALAKVPSCRASQGTIALTAYSGTSPGGAVTVTGGLAVAVHSPGTIFCQTGIATGTQITASINAPAGDVAIFAVASKSLALTVPSSLTALQNTTTLAGGYTAGTGAMSETFKANGADFLVSLALALPGTTSTALPPKQVPVTFTLKDTNGNALTGTITLYSVATNSSGFSTATPVPGGVCQLTAGVANCFVLAAQSGWYQFALSNGPITTSQYFMPGAFFELLSSANSISVSATLDSATGQPVKPYGVSVQ